MNNTFNPEELRKAPKASSCFMGLGQILYLKQYIRGGLFALVEVVMLFCIIWGSTSIIPPTKKAADYLKGIPETDEMEEYFSEVEAEKIQKKFNSIITARTKDYKKFAKKHLKNDFADIDFNEALDVDNSVEDLVLDLDDDAVYESFTKLDEKYDRQLAVLMAKNSDEEIGRAHV